MENLSYRILLAQYILRALQCVHFLPQKVPGGYLHFLQLEVAMPEGHLGNLLLQAHLTNLHFSFNMPVPASCRLTKLVHCVTMASKGRLWVGFGLGGGQIDFRLVQGWFS